MSELPAPLPARLADPASPGGGRRLPRRRVALAVVLPLAALAALAASGRVGAPRPRPAVAPAERPAPRAASGDAPRAPEPNRAGRRAPVPRDRSDRVVAATHAAALFAQHSWYVPPPPAPAAPPPPPPEPTAPPFPYTFVGSYAPAGDAPLFFLARGDRVIDARVGDRLEGVYQLESAAGGQLVFVYLPLHVRQSLAVSVSP